MWPEMSLLWGAYLCFPVPMFPGTDVPRTYADLPHDTDFPYVIRIIDDLRVIRPYHILIRNCFKYTEGRKEGRKELVYLTSIIIIQNIQR